MLMAHKIIDGAKNGDLMVSAGTQRASAISLIDGISLADKFDFGDLALDPGPEPGTWEIPGLTQVEKEAWALGLIPLPSPFAWYEFTLGKSRSGILITDGSQNDDPTKLWTCMRVDYHNDDKKYHFDGVVVGVDRSKEVPFSDRWSVLIGGNQTLIDLYKKTPGYDPSAMFGTNFALSVYLTLMINSRTADIATDVPPPKLNAARVKRGVQPLFEHRVVTIVPNRFRIAGDPQGGTHASPRLHWRRTHLRHLPSGRTIVIPRFLVGKPGLGEISHDYRVKL